MKCSHGADRNLDRALEKTLPAGRSGRVEMSRPLPVPREVG